MGQMSTLYMGYVVTADISHVSTHETTVTYFTCTSTTDAGMNVCISTQKLGDPCVTNILSV